MNQPPRDIARMLGHDHLLPCLQFDLALMLPARPVLRKEARPVFRVASDLGATVPLPACHGVARTYGTHGLLALVLKAGPRISAHDPQNPDILPAVASAAYAPISQVEA